MPKPEANTFPGKSTLQNELVGDLDVEFGHVPDSIEDMPLSILGENLKSTSSGRLGKKTSSFVDRLVSTKLPVGFNQTTLRSHLEQVWSLGHLRQNAVLLFAATSEPPARLESANSATEWLDSIVNVYAQSYGLELRRSTERLEGLPSNITVDSKQFDHLRQEQNAILFKQLSILQNHFGVDTFGHKETEELKVLRRKLQERLDHWQSEFSDDFELWIAPLFDPLKIRQYKSWWNSARQDIIKLYHIVEMGLDQGAHDYIDQVIYRVINRADKSVQDIIKSLTAVAESVHGSGDGFSSVGRQLISMTKKANAIPLFKYAMPAMAPVTTISKDGEIEYKETPRLVSSKPISYANLLNDSRRYDGSERTTPYVHIRSLGQGTEAEWLVNYRRTDIFLNLLTTACTSGISFAGKTILVTGAGPQSIGSEVVKGFLTGGAKVIVTTSRTPSNAAKFFEKMYNENGSQGSQLIMVPFNQGSYRDCEAVIDYIYDESGLNLQIDVLAPFAAISEVGFQVDDIGSKSEFSHRLMMTNVIRLIGRIISIKRRRGIDTRPTQVILPLSPNHGTFGGDGLYSESKLGLESLLNRFSSENWSQYVTICGALVGWTRGTGLMDTNDIVAQIVEEKGALTFSPQEMALNILALATYDIAQLCDTGAILADLNGGLDKLHNLNNIIQEGRTRVQEQSGILKAISVENTREKEVLDGPNITKSINTGQRAGSRVSLQVGFPLLPDYETALRPVQGLHGMVDFSSTLVIVGYSELGPWGSARTRWEKESRGDLSSAGYIELAWMMNLIKHIDVTVDGQHYCGWADVKTGDHVQDNEIKSRYSDHILAHTGIRFIEPDLVGGYHPEKKEQLQEITVEEDLPEFQTNEATAQALKLRLGDLVIVRPVHNTDNCSVQIKRGAHILVPKAVRAANAVGGQIPTGWNPTKYGIPEDIVHQVDPITLYSLCCAAEALYSAGLVDSLEIFKYIHVSEVGNMLGSCIGGATKTRNMYTDQYLDHEIQGDIIQETFLCASATWINMLLLGASGPIKTPNGTCATGVESLENACESILSGKTKLCLVGGVDDIQEDEAYGFEKIKATVDSNLELKKGRAPHEMSRPTTESRAGFVEAQGCGLQIVTTAELALDMGLPIYAVVASSTMAADKIGRSLPAPGQGLLTFAKEGPDASQSPLLSLNYRRDEMQARISNILESRPIKSQGQVAGNPHESEPEKYKSPVPNAKYTKAHESSIDGTTAHVKLIRKLFGNDFRLMDPSISPIRASLAVWGLTVDDLDIVSLHATSTNANDKNETEVINKQMTALGRTVGRPLLAICQKALTGHPKGAAASWMLNGCLQSMDTAIVPGNQNADCIDEQLRHCEHIVFPTEPIRVKEVKAFLLNSFGFGQKGAQVIGVAPKYLFATLDHSAYENYATKVTQRKRLANRAWVKAVNNNSVFKARASPPYDEKHESSIFLNTFARVSINNGGEFKFDDTH